MKKINKQTIKKLLPSLVLIILGLLFIIFSKSITNYIVLILGCILLIYGLSVVFYALYNKKKYNPTLNFYKGGITSLFGLLLIIFSKNIANLIMVFSGFYVVLTSLVSIYSAWKFYSPSKERNIRFILAFIELAIGLTISFSPQSSMSLICIFIGIYLLYKGIVIALNILAFKQKKNYGFFYTNSSFKEEKNIDPNIIDHDEITDDHIIKK